MTNGGYTGSRAMERARDGPHQSAAGILQRVLPVGIVGTSLIGAAAMTCCHVHDAVQHFFRPQGAVPAYWIALRRGRAPRGAGASRTTQRADLMGTSWREQTPQSYRKVI